MLFDIEIEVGGEKLTMKSVTVDDNGFFNTCACNENSQQKRVDGVWSPTYLVVSVGDGNVGKCGEQCKIEGEIAAGHMYVFDQWADEVMLSDRHANFSGASGVMKFSFEDGSDTIEFVDAAGPTLVKFTEAKANTEVVKTNVERTSSEEEPSPPTTPPTGAEVEKEVKEEEEEEDELEEARGSVEA